MKRGQIALEFLTTYGWAMMVVLVMIGGLAYLGVTDPSRFVSERCVADSGFLCEDFQLFDNQLRVLLRNNQGNSINIVNATVVNEDNIEISDCEGFSSTSLNNRQTHTFECDLSQTLSTNLLSRIELEFTFYNTASGSTFNRTRRVEVLAIAMES